MSVPSHYLRRNETTQLPRSFVYLDTEAQSHETPSGTVQSFLVAVVAYDRHATRTRKEQATQWATCASPRQTWEWIASKCQSHGRTVLVVHNLAYDLRVADAFAHLPDLGFELKAIRLDGGQAWASWRRDRSTLMMVDSTSWVPTSITHLGELVGIDKHRMPRPNAPTEEWEARCRADVEILRETWRRILRWLETEDMGTWKPTGAGQAWAAYRHRWMAVRPLVHEHADVKEVERRAAWAGRCEAWRWGMLGYGPWVEWDFEAAYAHVAAEAHLPRILLGTRGPMTAEARRTLSKRRKVLARCRVTTEVPCVPCAGPEGILWPVGTFETVLWDVEIDLVEREGGRCEVLECWLYLPEPLLARWASYVLGVLALPDDEVDPVVRLAVKHWSRALIGRFASRWSSWSNMGESPTSTVSLGWCEDRVEQSTYRLLQLGHQVMRSTDEQDSPDSCPAIMSYIMAACRVRLWDTMRAAGLDHVVYVDTDGLIVDAEGGRALRRAAIPGLREKHRWPTLEVLGPRQLICHGALRAAGVPRSAVRTGESSFVAEVWRQLNTSLVRGEHDRVVIVPRTIHLRGTDHRRRHEPDGSTTAYRLPA